KSGTNNFHGTLWEFVRNDKFDAINVDQWFLPANQRKKGELRRNQFGGAIGGPIVKKKMFFFGDYEGTRIRTGAEYIGNTVPTAAEAASGYTDFSDWLTQSTTTYNDVLGRTFNQFQIFDPATTRQVNNASADPVTRLPVSCPGTPASATCYVRDPFTNNQLPSGRLDQNAIKLLQLYPAATVPGALTSNYSVNRSQSDDSNHFDIREDNTLGQRDQLFGRISYSRQHANIPGSFT